MPVIRANRDSVDDRFSVLGFTVRSESPIAEVVVTTDPKLTLQENRSRRSRENFYSSRAGGGIRVRRGEAVYLVPPDVMANFVGASKLYFGLATYPEGGRGKPDFVQAPTTGNLYVNVSGLSERGLRRIASRAIGSGGYGQGNGSGDASLEWGGDWFSAPATAPVPKANGNGSGNAAVAAPPAAVAQGYSDGYDEQFWSRPMSAPPPLAKPLLVEPYYKPEGLVDALLTQLGFFLKGAAWFVGVPDTTVAPHNAICQVRRPLSGGGDEEIATAFFIAPRLLLTAAHVVEGESELIIVPGKNGNGTASANEPYGRFRVRPADWKAYRSDPSQGADFDLAVIRVPAANCAPRGRYFDLLEELTQSREEGVVVCGYAMNWTATTDIEHFVNRNIDPNRQHAHGGYIRELPSDGTFSYDLQTLGGTSGSPVYWIENSSPPRIHMVGVHVAANDATTNLGCRLTDDKIRWIHQQASGLGVAFSLAVARAPISRAPISQAQEIIQPFYNPADPSSALVCQADAFSQAREEWFAGVPDTKIFPHSAICLLEMRDASGAVSSRGTGFYIGRNRILTCAHNLHGQASVDVIPGNHDAQEPFGRFNMGSAAWRVSNRYPADGSDFDLAVIDGVPDAPNNRWFDVLEELRESRPEGVVVCGYSSRSDAVPELTAAINGKLQHLHAGYIAAVGNETFDYPILTLKRASGSPVYYLSNKSGAMKAYIVGVHVSGAPAATQGLNRGCRLTDAKIAWIEGRSTALGWSAKALENESFSVHWSDVPMYSQTLDTSCWAACAAMVVAWRDNRPVTDAEIAAKVAPLANLRKGLWPQDRKHLADVWDLVAEAPASYSVDGWREMLETYGPLYVDQTWSGSSGGHVRVLVGMTSDGAADGSSTMMFVHDPWPSKGQLKIPFRDFITLYEGRTETSGGELQFQILHAAQRRSGATVATAAPFSLDARAPSPRPRAGALSGESSDYAVTLIPQPNKIACWAASMAMLLSFRRQQSITPETLAQEVGRSLESSYGWDALSAVRDHYGFVTIAQPSNTSLYVSPQQWAQWLSQHGPLWVVVVGTPHAVVLAGIKGDLSNPDSVKVKILNPWDTRVDFDDNEISFNPANNGYADWLPFSQFASEFGNMAESNYGRWRVLHLPAQAATSKGLGSAAPAMCGSRLPPPPPPVRALNAGEVNGARFVGGTPGEMPIEPSRIPGTTMRTINGSAGRASWALDQLDGFKHATPDPMIVATPLDKTIELRDWPRLGNDPPALPLSVIFASGAKAVGNVRIAPSMPPTPPALPYDVRVVARIQDDNSIEASASGVACIEVVVEVFFTGTAEGDRCARTRLRLRGDGQYDSVADWVSRPL